MEQYSFVLNLAVLTLNLLMMVSVGLSLEPGHFLALARIKFAVLGLLTAQTLLLPMIGLLVVSVLPLPPHVKAGVLLLAACPVGDLANFYSLLAKADTALSVTLNMVSCALAVLTMPAVFAVYQFVQGDAFEYAIPNLTLVAQLTLMIVVPLVAGMTVRRFRSDAAARLLVPLRLACTIGIMFLLLAVFVVQRGRLAADWRPTMTAACFLLSAATCAGLGVAALLRLPRRQLVSGAITFPVRNIGLALAVAVSLLGRLEYAAFAAIFFLVEVPLLMGLVVGYRRWFRRSDTEVGNLTTSAAMPEGQSGI